MPKISERFVKNAIFYWLQKNNWKMAEFTELHKKGIDIKARKLGKCLFIEAKGESKQSSKNAMVTGLGQLLINMRPRYGHYRYALAMPISAQKTIFKDVPEIWECLRDLKIDIFFVDNKKNVQKYNWRKMRDIFKKAS